MGEAPCSDAELVVRTCSGDTDAFAVLVQRHQDYIYNAALHMVGSAQQAEDVAQEVFLKAFRGLRGFRQRAKFSTWLYGIMVNCVRSHWRRVRRRPDPVSLDGNPNTDNPSPDPASPDGGPLSESVRREEVEMVRRAIAGLASGFREVIVLRDIEGLSYEELAQTLDVPLGTVKSRLFRARNALRGRIIAAQARGI